MFAPHFLTIRTLTAEAQNNLRTTLERGSREQVDTNHGKGEKLH